jgi:hypothetical protein
MGGSGVLELSEGLRKPFQAPKNKCPQETEGHLSLTKFWEGQAVDLQILREPKRLTPLHPHPHPHCTLMEEEGEAADVRSRLVRENESRRWP